MIVNIYTFNEWIILFHSYHTPNHREEYSRALGWTPEKVISFNARLNDEMLFESQEYLDWIENELTGRCRVWNDYTCFFQDDSDVLAFRLKWL